MIPSTLIPIAQTTTTFKLSCFVNWGICGWGICIVHCSMCLKPYKSHNIYLLSVIVLHSVDDCLKNRNNLMGNELKSLLCLHSQRTIFLVNGDCSKTGSVSSKIHSMHTQLTQVQSFVSCACTQLILYMLHLILFVMSHFYNK